MGENFAIFVRFYREPGKAASDALDKGSFAFALTMTVLVLMLWVFGMGGPMRVAGPPIALRYPHVCIGFDIFWPGCDFPGVGAGEYWSDRGLGFARFGGGGLTARVSAGSRPRFARMGGCLFAIRVVQMVFAAIYSSGTGALRFFSALHYLPRDCARNHNRARRRGGSVGWVAAVGAFVAFPIVGNLSYFLLSPWVFYMLYRSFSPDVRSLGESMNSRRNFRRQLEAAMLNPKDADAHYQLGLIYQQRRQYDEAAASFRRAIEIYPHEAEAHLQLGRALACPGEHRGSSATFRDSVAVGQQCRAAGGMARFGRRTFGFGSPQSAIEPLERYTNHRSYDPEGLFYFGTALQAAGRSDEAQHVFQQTLEAVETAPKYRRGQLRKWAGLAKSELRKL